ncbi:FAM210A [Branchiostoma lanceolatum]|uniref:FAM210A protein n=1 Tax=Branchiostoma lanceolatum TaxID=7740 RepID=A0A8K0A7R4_BRALA|nr:FAM210A [Branchiostoma lanceolatum]
MGRLVDGGRVRVLSKQRFGGEASGSREGVLRSVHGWQEGIRDMVSRPTTWLQQPHRPAVPHRRTNPGAVISTARPYRGVVLPAARCHTVTSHTFSTKLFPPRGGAACVHCCTVHSSANVAQRREEKQQAVQEDQKEEEEEEDLDEKYRNLTLFQRFKYMVKDYGHVLIPVHVATSLVWFGSFYYMAICGVDPVPLLEQIGLPHSWVETMKKSGASDVMVAYAFYKIATPARYTVTLGGTTFTIRYLRKKGVMQKPPPSKHMEKMKGFIQEKRDLMKK